MSAIQVELHLLAAHNCHALHASKSFPTGSMFRKDDTTVEIAFDTVRACPCQLFVAAARGFGSGQHAAEEQLSWHMCTAHYVQLQH
jgi:hypothetical protein